MAKEINPIKKFRSKKLLIKFLLKKYPDVIHVREGFVGDDFIRNNYTIEMEREDSKIIKPFIIIGVNQDAIKDCIGRIYTNYTIVSIKE